MIEKKTTNDIIQIQDYDADLNKVWISEKSLIEWLNENALMQTTYSDFCSDDGFIMFKKDEIKAQGDWSQTEWTDKINNFEKEYIYYEEILKELEKVKK